GDHARVLAFADVKLIPGNFASVAGNVRVDTALGALVLPKMTKAARNAIPTPENSMLIYQTDNTPGLREYRNGAWGILGWTADPENEIRMRVFDPDGLHDARSAVRFAGNFREEVFLL